MVQCPIIHMSYVAKKAYKFSLNLSILILFYCDIVYLIVIDILF